MFIKLFIIMSMAYYIVRTINPEFYSEMMLEDLLKRNEDCKTIDELLEKAKKNSDMKDIVNFFMISLLSIVHMLIEVIIICTVIIKFKNIIAVMYLVFWIIIYAVRRKQNKNNKGKADLDILRSSLKKCYKLSNRLIVFVDLIFFAYIFFSIVL